MLKVFLTRKVLMRFGLVLAPILPMALVLACTRSYSAADLVTRRNPNEEIITPDDPGNVPAAYSSADGLKLNPQWPFSMSTLNAVARQITGEDLVPWRFGITNEAVTQTFSLVRALAVDLGWNPRPKYTFEPDGAITKRPNTVYITDQNVADNFDASALNTDATTNKLLIGGDVDNASEEDKAKINAFIQNVSRMRASTSETPWANSFERKLATTFWTGDLGISEADLGVYKWAGLTNIRTTVDLVSANPNDLPYQQVIVKGTTDYNYAADNLLWSWADMSNPGTSFVAVRLAYRDKNDQGEPFGKIRGYATRIVRIAKPTIKYPIIEQKIYEREFVPIFQQLLTRFLSLIGVSTIDSARRTGATFAPDLEDLVTFISNNQNSERFLTTLNKLNNGSHHLLPIVAFWKGFDTSIAKSAIWDFVTPGASSGFIPVWEKDKALSGMTKIPEGANITSLFNFLAWFRFSQLGFTSQIDPKTNALRESPAATEPFIYALYFKDYPTTRLGARAAFFTNKSTMAELVEANRAGIFKLPTNAGAGEGVFFEGSSYA